MKSNESQPVFREMVLRCKDCDATFILRKQEQEYLFRMHLAPYVRCAECRQRNRLNRLQRMKKGGERNGG